MQLPAAKLAARHAGTIAGHPGGTSACHVASILAAVHAISPTITRASQHAITLAIIRAGWALPRRAANQTMALMIVEEPYLICPSG